MKTTRTLASLATSSTFGSIASCLAPLAIVAVVAFPATANAAPSAAKDATPPASASAGASASTDSKSDTSGSSDTSTKGDAKAGNATVEDASAGTSADVTEAEHKTYRFIGLRYRGTIIPKFMVNLFVDEGATFYSNSIGAEIDLRKDGESKIFGLSYVEYGTGDTIFLQKGHNLGDVGWMSYVNSSLKGIYATADFLYSVDLNAKKNLQYEYGFGAGLGVLFGDLVNNWIYQSAGGPLVDSAGNHYEKCPALPPGTPSPNRGCNTYDHQSASIAKTGGYIEKSWLGGGSVPNIFPYLALQVAGLRYKPIKELETRAGVGLSLTGFYFTLSADYGLPDSKDQSAPPSGGTTAKHPTVGNRAFAF